MGEGIKVGDFTSRSRILELVFPVGAVYQSFQPESPAEWLGGTWELLEEGRTLVAASDPGSAVKKYPVGTVGGEASVKLNATNLPNHTVTSNTLVITNVGGTDYGWATGGAWRYWLQYAHLQNPSMGGSTTPCYPLTSVFNGGNQPHNNESPYISVYIWRRIA